MSSPERRTAGPTDGYGAAFDRLFDRGRAAVLSGTHYRDSPPVDGGWWGMSVVLPPDPGCTGRLAAVTAEALAVAGPRHWPTGAPQAAHFTVRAIEAHRTAVPGTDPLVRRVRSALRRAATACRPVRLELRGLTLTPSGVMACAYPVDSAADDFAARLGAELGDDAWFEADFSRDIWYATLVHFTGPLRDPAALVDWVAARRGTDLGEAAIGAAELLRFRFDGRQPVRLPLTSAPFGATLR
ncbi:hypothetical protein [Plantactinospora endophytica]|uniref:2'-5' RNA ligase family protein n=1 Tax=Plantactinospora endophytica TaxID=673535 RepID=A0ABQ4EBG9_9ACTN|nr:hypothetical protein [Plantactinospora endophytica]GIG92038.1 hypothetical protein Pen02_69740 [Plantactinospora endophytica]